MRHPNRKGFNEPQANRIKTKHHLTPKARKMRDKTILTLWSDNHFYWHKLFGNRTLSEAIALLKRIQRIKYPSSLGSLE